MDSTQLESGDGDPTASHQQQHAATQQTQWWERWTSESRAERSADEELFVFGYSCKLFRDDERAKEIDSGKHLIPWMASESLLIDRFDVRGYLSDLKQHEPNKCAVEELTPNELETERLCEIERYADLNSLEEDHEEELKRLHLALADGTGYHQMQYNYDTNATNANEIESEPVIEPEKEETNKDCFKIPSGLSLPEGITLPESQKLHNIIEKTAYFVSQHGTQMEIIVKAKQSLNSNFQFLSFDSPLNPYYRVLLSNIKSGKYTPKQIEEQEKSDESDSDDGDHYLHPSLLGSGKDHQKTSNMPLNIPNLLRFSNNSDSYSQLVKSFKEKYADNEEDKSSVQPSSISNQTNDNSISANINNIENENNSASNNINVNSEDKSSGLTSPLVWSSILPSPPPDIEIIIEKLAQRVAKNGDEFEISIRKLGETRFEFVNPGNIYHAHYIRRKLHYLEENRKTQVIANIKINHKKSNRSESYASKAPVSFSIGAKESKQNSQSIPSEESSSVASVTKRETDRTDRNTSSEHGSKRTSNNALKDKLAYAARERVAKEKQLQEERKRKAAVFLSMIKKQAKEAKLENCSEDNAVKTGNAFGPELPKPALSEQQLSPTIVAVTSPTNSPEIHKTGDDLSADAVFNKNFESSKSGSLLPFIASDKPLKELSSRHSSSHRHHRYKHSKKRSRSPKEKLTSSSKSRSPSTARSPSHKKHKKSSKSRSRSRSRSHSRSHKRSKH